MIIKLGEVASYINGYAFKPSDWSDNGMPIIRIQDLTGNSYKMNRYNGDVEQKYKVKEGDVLISWSASLGVYVWHGENAVLNQHIFKVVFDKTDVSKDYFVYQIEYRLKNAASEAHGATMKHLTKAVFNALPFYLPKKEEQEKIAKVLNKITELTNKTRKQAKLLDDIIKSRFIELFGDPVYNTKNNKKKTLEQIGKWASGGTPSRNNGSYFEGTIDWYSAGELNSLYLNNSIEKITDEAINCSSAKLFPAGSMLVGMYDTAAFKMGILKKTSSCNQACACVIPNENINIIWLYYELYLMKEYFLSQRRGVRQKNLNLGMIKKFEIPVSKYEDQLIFADFVAQTDKSKLAVQKSLDELETLKKSLMQEYFG